MLLHSVGYSDRQIAIAVREINKVKRLRERTIDKLSLYKMEENAETLAHKVKQFLFHPRHRKAHSR
jgi:hypothetical protein